jgi:hypothetical protein
MMFGYKIFTCGHTVSRLKETALRLANGEYELPTAEHVFSEYLRVPEDTASVLSLGTAEHAG